MSDEQYIMFLRKDWKADRVLKAYFPAKVPSKKSYVQPSRHEFPVGHCSKNGNRALVSIVSTSQTVVGWNQV